MELEKLKEILVDTLGCDEDAITPEAKLKEDLGIDSLDAVELVMAIEEEVGVKIPDEELPQIKTIQEVLDCVERHSA